MNKIFNGKIFLEKKKINENIKNREQLNKKKRNGDL